VEQSPSVLATVSEWRNEKGWGVVFAEGVTEGIWVHFSNIETAGYKTLSVGQVEVEVEGPLPFEQDGFRYRARRLLVPLY
jgi:CspA family cold shock protein